MTEDDVRKIVLEELKNSHQETSVTDNAPIPLILMTLFIMFLVFVFWGDPDIWDLLHSKVIADLS